MPYNETRVVHDADAHIMEWPTWLIDYADPAVRDRLEPHDYGDDGAANPLTMDRLREKHASAEYRADEQAEIMARKNFWATGGFISEDRPRALDLLGFSSQLIFNTFNNSRFSGARGDLDLAYGTAGAHNRGMLDFCAADRGCCRPLRPAGRFRPVAAAARGRSRGCGSPAGALGLPAGHSPSHIGLDPVWATPRRPASRWCSTSAAR